ncbi:MAG: hypothetical protein PWP32_1160 [Methanothermobacter sp.]|jgi:hypothetical protein|uniref:DUF2238 domain-containing protein n=1 Tax=Methanothermobacter thermautotrophicus TaxID=145262 RepID=A0A7J4MV52_METTF|nr:hypothetical protein [Methanothermobacter sp.]MDN5374395.1 hypothetical protein [Methanothermobacter sp.]HIH64609.1 hypothetical protein [Methanothermobacter thermautotrophicus]
MNECPENSSWKLKLLTSIRILLVLMGVIIVVFGAGGTKVFGLITLIAVAVVYLPALRHPHGLRVIPVEIEILFLTVVALEYILGNTLGLYGRIAYYDKFMHFTVPFIVALIGMMLIYTAYVYGKIRTSLLIMAFLIVFVTLGLGALLELVEYGYDHYLYQHIEHVLPTGPTQGSPVMDPLADTMFDLLTDLLGGVFGAVTGVILVRRAERKNYCLEWVDDVARFEGIDEDQG